ncbi:MAG: hypothetical protein KJ593_07720 [Candidatus Omnitrophica bacterium]|nr:hypothetical protein [Candidatus Omnitrophota bacterium]
MSRDLLVVLVLTLSLMMVSICGVLFAQEEEIGYIYGIVKSVSPDYITVTEYDYINEQEIDTTYVIDPATELSNVDSLENINMGDNVGIDYIIRDEKRVAKIIIVYKESYEEEYKSSEIENSESEEPSIEIEY